MSGEACDECRSVPCKAACQKGFSFLRICIASVRHLKRMVQLACHFNIAQGSACQGRAWCSETVGVKLSPSADRQTGLHYVLTSAQECLGTHAACRGWLQVTSPTFRAAARLRPYIRLAAHSSQVAPVGRSEQHAA